MSELDFETELKLSFYDEISTLGDPSKGTKIKLVKHNQNGRIYVMKELPPDCLPFFKIREANKFYGVPEIAEIIQTPSSIVVIEEYISGSNLEKNIHEGLFSEKDAIHIINQLCDILAQFHNLPTPVINRDIKPSNIILDPYGKVCLVDFDTSKFHTPDATRDTVLMGTPGYAAPEQYGFLQSDVTTDIYALGVLLNKMLTGEFPSDELYRGSLTKVISKCISLNPKDRFRNVEELKNSLQRQPENNLKLSLPGFRSGKLGKKILAVLGYGFAIWLMVFCIYDGIKSPEPDTLHLNVTFAMMVDLIFLGNLFYLSNYMGMRDRIPFRKTNNSLVEFMRISLTVFAYSTVAFVICALI